MSSTIPKSKLNKKMKMETRTSMNSSASVCSYAALLLLLALQMTTTQAQQLSLQGCKINLSLTDTAIQNGYLDPTTEYIAFLNRMTQPTPCCTGATFATIPVNLQTIYSTYAATSPNQQLDINGARPGTVATSPAQLAALDGFCTELITALSGASAGAAATTMPVAATANPFVPGAATAAVVPGAATASPVVPGAATAAVVYGAATANPVVPGAATAAAFPGAATANPAIPGAATANPAFPGAATTMPVTPGVATANPNISPNTLPPMVCKSQLGGSDTLVPDGMLSQDEYVAFVNKISSNAFVGQTFATLPAPVQAAYSNTAAAQGGQVSIFGASAVQQPSATPAQAAALDQFCAGVQTALRTPVGAATAGAATTMPVGVPGAATTMPVGVPGAATANPGFPGAATTMPVGMPGAAGMGTGAPGANASGDGNIFIQNTAATVGPGPAGNVSAVATPGVPGAATPGVPGAGVATTAPVVAMGTPAPTAAMPVYLPGDASSPYMTINSAFLVQVALPNITAATLPPDISSGLQTAFTLFITPSAASWIQQAAMAAAAPVATLAPTAANAVAGVPVANGSVPVAPAVGNATSAVAPAATAAPVAAANASAVPGVPVAPVVRMLQDTSPSYTYLRGGGGRILQVNGTLPAATAYNPAVLVPGNATGAIPTATATTPAAAGAIGNGTAPVAAAAVPATVAPTAPAQSTFVPGTARLINIQDAACPAPAAPAAPAVRQAPIGNATAAPVAVAPVAAVAAAPATTCLAVYGAYDIMVGAGADRQALYNALVQYTQTSIDQGLLAARVMSVLGATRGVTVLGSTAPLDPSPATGAPLPPVTPAPTEEPKEDDGGTPWGLYGGIAGAVVVLLCCCAGGGYAYTQGMCASLLGGDDDDESKESKDTGKEKLNAANTDDDKFDEEDEDE